MNCLNTSRATVHIIHSIVYYSNTVMLDAMARCSMFYIEKLQQKTDSKYKYQVSSYNPSKTCTDRNVQMHRFA